MFLSNAIKTRLSSLLQPWVERETDIELRLGFLRSSLCVQNVLLNVNSLNEFVDESMNLSVQSARIEKLSIQISPFSSPVLSLEVNGVDVTISPRQLESCSRERNVASDDDLTAKARKEMLALLDPEGSSLHDTIGSILATTPGSWSMIAIASTVLNHCLVQINGIHIQLQLTVGNNLSVDNVPNGFHACFLRVKELRAEGLLLRSLFSFFKDLFGSLFRSQAMAFLRLSAKDLEFGLKRRDHLYLGHVNPFASFKNLSIYVKLNHFLPTHVEVHAPKTNFRFSPRDLPGLLLVYLILIPDNGKPVLSARNGAAARSGRELWKMAACRIGYLSPRFSLHKLVDTIISWRLHVHAYETLLLQVGYSNEKKFKLIRNQVAQDRKLLSHIRHQWEVLAEVELKLPVEAVASARRVARFRAALNFQDSYSDLSSNIHTTYLSIVAFLSNFWKFMYYIFHLCSMSLSTLFGIPHFLHGLLRKGVPRGHPEKKMLSSSFLSIGCSDASRISFNLGKISIMMSPIDTFHHLNEKLKTDTHISLLDLHSICLSVNALSLIHIADDNAKILSLACGEFKIQSLSSLSRGSPKERSLKIDNRSFSGLGQETGPGSKLISWSEPTQLHRSDKGSMTDFVDMLLESHLSEMWSDWQRNSNIEITKIRYAGSPFLLCVIKSFIVNPYLSGQNVGLLKCGLSMGKLNCDLEYSTVLSMSLLLMQMQDALLCTHGGMKNVVSNSSNATEEHTEIKLENWYGYYANRVKMKMFSMNPEKNIQLGLSIAGPKIRISVPGVLSSKEHASNHVTQGYGDYSIAVGLDNLQIAVWPSRTSVLAALTQEFGMDEATTEYIWLKEPRLVDISKAATINNYISRGRIAHNISIGFKGIYLLLEDLVENQFSQVMGQISLTFQFSSSRDYLHSLTTNQSVLSMALDGTVSGATIFSYMDELSVLFQVLGDILLAVVNALSSLECINDVSSQEFLSLDSVSAGNINDLSMLASETKAEALIFKSTCFLIDANLEFKPVDIVLNNSRKEPITRGHTKVNGASSNAMKRKLDVPDLGIRVSIQQSGIKFSWEEEGSIDVRCVMSGIQSVIFRYQTQTEKNIDESEVGNSCFQYAANLYEFSLSDSTFSLCAGLNSQVSSVRVSQQNDGWRMADAPQGTSSTVSGEEAMVDSHSWWFLMHIELGDLFMGEHSSKNVIVEAHQPTTANKLQASFSIGGKFHTIFCEIQGGLLFLETKSLATFIDCFRGYLTYIMNLSSRLPSWADMSSGKGSEIAGTGFVLGESTPMQTDFSGRNHTDIIPSESHSLTDNLEAKWKFMEFLRIRVSWCSLVLAVEDSSVGAWELVLETDFELKYELKNMKTKFQFDLFCLTVFAQPLHRSYAEETVSSPQIPHFQPTASNSSSSSTRSGYHAQVSRAIECTLSETSVPTEEITKEGCISGDYILHSRNYILKHMVVSVMVEKALPVVEEGPLKTKNDWVGTGSVSGLDLAITISEIWMLLALIAPLAGLSTGNTSHSSRQNVGSGNRGFIDSSEYTIPDGAVVAIQDLDQHMYLTAEAIENKFRLVGSIHYSLAGERALFRVKYHHQRRWGSSISWFSLTSLHAKNETHEPFRVNFRSDSIYVDLSSTDDREWALWRTILCKPESFENDNELESYNPFLRGSFYLVNRKSDYAVAFVDELPEFVKKPGNAFKVKVFPDFPLIRAVSVRELQKANTDATSTYDNSGQSSSLPHVNINIDKATLTILHDATDANDQLPLLRCCIENVQFIMQILSSKTRIIGTFKAMINCFDPHYNLWNEIVAPVQFIIFCRSRSESYVSDVHQKGVPFHLYFRIKQVDISLTEFSMDVLLFLIGEMNLAGPYTVRHSRILANCCKVENVSGLSLLCHFNDNRDTIVAAHQSASIFLRPAVSIGQSQDITNLVSLQLFVNGAFSSSPINVSLLDAGVFAWRARLHSLEDSRSFPGSFIVADVSKKTEDGLSLVVSPMLRIHNESGFSLELHCRRPQEKEDESASVLLRNGDTIDDSMAVVDALNLSGGHKKALTSLTLGNFLLSFRPEITEYFEAAGNPVSLEWSEDLKGGKSIRVSGIFDKLNYRIKKAFGVDSIKSSFSSVHCSLSVQGVEVSKIHFLVQTIGRDVPITRPYNLGDSSDSKYSPIAMKEQKEIFILPTVQISNLLQSEILVLLTENYPDLSTANDYCSTGKESVVPSGSSVYLYANPALIFFTVTLTAFNSKCKTVNSGDWVKKLQKQRPGLEYLDIQLDFCGGKYFACLRLSRGDRGILKATVFTPYTLQNGTDLSFFCFDSYQKPISREEADKYGLALPPERGSLLPPNSSISWFLKSNKVHLKCLEDSSTEAILDLDSLSGFTEICLEIHEEIGVKCIVKLGVSLKPMMSKEIFPSQLVYVVPRFVIFNESEEDIFVRQCYLQDDVDAIVAVSGKQKVALRMRLDSSKRQEISYFDAMFRKHRSENEDSFFVQFCLKEIGWSWSGPVCIASLGRFFVKFKRQPVSLESSQSNPSIIDENKLTRFGVVHIVEEGSTLLMHFDIQHNFTLPYRIENCLHDVFITYYQKGWTEPEILGNGKSIDYIWDDLTLPHKLVVQIDDMHLLREISIDKLCEWKPFHRRKNRGLALFLPIDQELGKIEKINSDKLHGQFKVGYEVYADGPSRVLRICELVDSIKEIDQLYRSSAPSMKIEFRASHFAIHFLENGKQDVSTNEASIYPTIIVARLESISLDSLCIDKHKFNQIRVQTLNVDEKWQGAPFAAMVRRNQLDFLDTNEHVLRLVFILQTTSSNVKQVKYSSVILQPIDLNIDEETLMRLVPFWRTSLSTSTQSQQIYFKHFEIHPIKIVVSFLPGNPYASYSSAQEALRSLLHSVIKIPSVKGMIVELNGVLLTHALVTARELLIKCAQHYSWYAMRAIYIAKQSPLLPPAFASIFDDSAASSLDVFFDPSGSWIKIPGLSIGMFKVISKCINKKGFSGTKRYFGDLGKTVKKAGSNVLFAAITEISDNVLRGAETSGFNGMVNGFHQGILKLAMEPALLGTAVMEGGPDRRIKLDRSPAVDELYIEGYLQAMLDVLYKQEYLRVRVIDDQVLLKNLPPNSSLINEIMEHVKGFLVSKALLKGEAFNAPRSLRHPRGENDWKIGPTVLTLCEHLFVSFVIRMLRKQAGRVMSSIKWKGKPVGEEDEDKAMVLAPLKENKEKFSSKRVLGKFVMSSIVAYVDGRLCRCIPNAILRRIVSGFLLSFLDKNDKE